MAKTKEEGTRVDTMGNSNDSPTAATGLPGATARPENVYELLERVCEHILAEPRRYHQGSWLLQGAAILANDLAEPPCGTVACRAGWIVALVDGIEDAAGLIKVDWNGIEHRAYDILGMSEDDYGAGELFDEDALALEAGYDIEEDDLDDCDLPQIGTVKYAEAGAAGVRAFMERYADHLKARKLSDVPPIAKVATK